MVLHRVRNRASFDVGMIDYPVAALTLPHMKLKPLIVLPQLSFQFAVRVGLANDRLAGAKNGLKLAVPVGVRHGQREHSVAAQVLRWSRLLSLGLFELTPDFEVLVLGRVVQQFELPLGQSKSNLHLQQLQQIGYCIERGSAAAFQVHVQTVRSVQAIFLVVEHIDS